MKNTVLIIVSVIVLSACGASKVSVQSLNGDWKETWGYGVETDIDYHDEYRITVINNTIAITCTNNDSYTYRDLQYNNGTFSFIMTNTSGNDDLPYWFTVTKDKSRMLGTAVSVHGDTVPILWERIVKD